MMRQYSSTSISMANISFIAIALAIALALIPAMCFAGSTQQVDPGSFTTTSSGFMSFFVSVKAAIANVLSSPELLDMTEMMWRFFTVMGILWLFAKYAMNGANFVEIFAFMFTVLVVRALMHQYDMLTTAVWSWGEGVSHAIQIASTGQDGLFWLSRYIWNATTAMSFGVVSYYNPIKLFAILCFNLISLILCALGSFATVWALWGYALTKMIGFIFIPLILFEELSWLFDGWLRFFFGFILYNIISTVCLVLVVISLQCYFNLPSKQVPVEHAMSFSINSVAEGAGIFTFMLMSVVGLISIGFWVSRIVGGGRFGVSAGIRQVGSAIGKSVSTFL